MGILTMALKDEGSSGDRQSSQIQSLSRQGSLYNMTLNEVQNHLGEPLHSMNLDELLKSVFAVETNQLNGVDHENPMDQHASSSGIHRQGSITMSQELCKKTVDEVWQDIQIGPNKGDEVKKSGHEKRQTTLGEMTLEDFLLKAGVVTESIMKEGNDFIGNLDHVENPDLTSRTQGFTHGTSWLQQFNQIPAMNKQMQGQQSLLGAYMPVRPLPQPIGAGSAPMFDAVFPEGQMNISSPTIGGYSDSQTPGRKRRTSEDIVDRLSERRQKRMIKNRESAARSRARKQAYTNELENKVSRLEEENERLKKQKELDQILMDLPVPEPRYQLRRTSSAPL
ncbi:ABSCISIC ACID-INSENSITIVE 5-like protein 2 [Curcuma longa]|uniref:ABSCISIC ACID-INSENSITIVE 5-like protein 2 n=1 Tax=Curcuma longa TaxID=136217 RepID=UPI003D9F404A